MLTKLSLKKKFSLAFVFLFFFFLFNISFVLSQIPQVVIPLPSTSGQTIIINGSATGNCPAGYAVQNITATTIQCVLMAGGTGGGDFYFANFTASFNSNFSGKDTDSLSQGSINLYDNKSWNEIYANTLYTTGTQLTNNITALSNSTIVRQGNYNCSTGQVFQNATINSSGIYGQCVTASSGVLNYNNITMLNVTTQNMTFYNLNVSNNFNVNDTIQLNETFHVNLITYGTFTGSGSNWFYNEPPWRYASNHIEKYADGTGFLSSTEGGCYAGNKYRVTYTVSSWTAGTYSITSCGVTLVTRIIAGTYTEDIIATTSSGNFRVTPSNTARFNMDDVSLYQIQGTFRLGRTIFTQHENDQNIQSYNLPYSQGDGVLTNSAGQLGWSNTYTPTVWNAKADYSFGSNNFIGTGNFITAGNLNLYPNQLTLIGTGTYDGEYISTTIYNSKPVYGLATTYFIFYDSTQWVLSNNVGGAPIATSPTLTGTYGGTEVVTISVSNTAGNTDSVSYSSGGVQGITDCYDSSLGGQVCSTNGLVNSITDDPSDTSLKANVKNLTLDLNKFSQLTPSEWIWNMTNKKGSGYGLIAQDLEKIYPQLVRNGTMTVGNKKVNYKTIDYAGIITLLISKNQQLETNNINLQKQLEINNINLQKQIDSIKKCISDSRDYLTYKLCVSEST